VVLAIFICLEEHCAGGNKGGIGGYRKLLSRIRVSKNQLVKKAIFQSEEGIIGCVRPGKLDILLCEINQGVSEVGKMQDEVLIEVAQ